MHTYIAPNGTVFNFNSDMSGEVLVRGTAGVTLAVESAEINGEDIVAFATHWLAHYNSDDPEAPPRAMQHAQQRGRLSHAGSAAGSAPPPLDRVTALRTALGVVATVAQTIAEARAVANEAFRIDEQHRNAQPPIDDDFEWPAGPPTSSYQQVLRAALAYTMSEISEEGFCAQWMMGLEYDLWLIVTARRSARYGQTDVTLTQVGLLLALSEATGGWIHWDEQLGRETFIPLDEWRTRVAARQPS